MLQPHEIETRKRNTDSFNNAISIIRMLLDKGVDLKYQNDVCRTPIDLMTLGLKAILNYK